MVWDGGYVPGFLGAMNSEKMEEKIGNRLAVGGAMWVIEDSSSISTCPDEAPSSSSVLVHAARTPFD